jgi:hypothetical protein
MIRVYKDLICVGAGFGLLSGLIVTPECRNLPEVLKTIFSHTVSGAFIASTIPMTAPIELFTDLKPLSYSVNIAESIVSRVTDEKVNGKNN